MTVGDPTPTDETDATQGSLHVSRLHPSTEAALRRAWHEAAKDHSIEGSAFKGNAIESNTVKGNAVKGNAVKSNADKMGAARQRALLPVPFETYAPAVLRLWQRGRARLALTATEEAFCTAISRMHHSDLYLARACDAGDDRAWSVFVAAYEGGLTRLVARHASGSDAERVSTAVIADLSLPSPSGQERTLLGTYEGTGSMWGWLTAIAVRRARKSRRPREYSLQDDEARQSANHAGQNEASAEWNDELQKFASQLKEAWAKLETREQVALVLKFRDGRTQREIATLLRSTPPTMTRVIHQAVAKLRGRLAPRVGTTTHSTELWTRFEATLASHLEMQVPAHRKDDV